MTFFRNICLFLFAKLKGLAGLKTLFPALIISLFIYGQIGSTAHAHDHEHDTQHKPCEVCILAINDDESVCDDIDLPDLSEGPDIVITEFYSDIGKTTAQLELNFSLYTPPKSASLTRHLDAARAPPLPIMSIVEHI
ncbi:MAG: hypothetical protein ABJG88_09710 [Litorimonas sp.]